MALTLPSAALTVEDASRDSSEARAFSLSPADVRSFVSQLQPAHTRRHLILNTIEWLKVEKSARYAPTRRQSFCNVYAHDLCFLLGIYLPRIWWTERALSDLRNGRPLHVDVGGSVVEMSANSLFGWLGEFGEGFGWQPLENVARAVEAANRGSLVLACARTSGGHGHISVVLPDGSAAARNVAHVSGPPPQSQAGRRNVEIGNLGQWWLSFPEFAFWAAAPGAPPNEPFGHSTGRKTLLTWAGDALGKVFLARTVRALDLSLSTHAFGRPRPTVSPSLVKALMAAEDRRFFSHSGFDVRSIARAIFRRVQTGSVQGASTIEQQLVRTLTQRRGRTIWRKFTEIILAIHVARRVPKTDIAEIYLRAAYFGWRMNGAPQACNRLGIDLLRCSLQEACEVVAALRYPFPMHPTSAQEILWRRRAAYILRRMRQTGARRW